MKKKVEPTWVKTRTPLLWKHTPSGGFYARVKVAGKDNWKSLDTDIHSVAKNRLNKTVRAIRGSKNRVGAPTVTEALEAAAKDKKDNPDAAKNTGHYHEAIKNACERLELPHLRLHDLRHIFATRCPESGVDLPTITRWLGHKDGGLLAASIYGHLTDDHSATQAGKVQA